MSSNIIRIDKNTVHNYLNFDTHGQETGDIIRFLLVYFSKQNQNSFWGFGKLDPVAFSKEMKMSLARLRSKSPKPFQFDRLTADQIEALYNLEKEDPEEFRVWDSNLENALYILLKSNILYPNNYITKSSIKGKTSSLKSVQVLTELKAHFKAIRGGSKITYSYTLSPEFIDNISTFFLHIHVGDLVRLRKSNNDGLYMHLSNELQGMRSQFLEMKELNFDILCKKAGINSKRPRDNKARLINSFKKIQATTKLTIEHWGYEFIKKNQSSKWEYKVMLINKNLYKNQNEKLEDYNTKFSVILTQNIFRETLSIYKSIYGEGKNTPKEYSKWMIEGDNIDKEEKILAYKKAYFRVKGNIPQYIDNTVKSWFRELKEYPSDHIFYKE